MSHARSLFVDQLVPHDPLNNSTRVIKALILLCLALSATVVGWMHYTTAEVVIRVPGRLRSAGMDDGSGERTRQLQVQIAGVVQRVCFGKGDTVQKGDPVLELDPREIDHQIAAGESLQAKLQDEIASLVRSEDLLRSNFSSQQDELEAELAAATETYEEEQAKRRVELQAAKAILQAAAEHNNAIANLVPGRELSKVAVAEIKKQLRLAELEVEKLRVPLPAGNLEVLSRKLASLDTTNQLDKEQSARDVNRLRRELEAARLELEDLRLLRQKLVMYSPLDGVVTAVAVYPADFVRPGAVGIWIAHAGFEFEVQVPIREAPHLRLGQLARIELDSADLQNRWLLEGEVKSISPDSTLANGGGSRVPVYVVRVAIPHLEQQLGERLQHLRLGATGRVEIITGDTSVLRAVLDKGIDMTRWD